MRMFRVIAAALLIAVIAATPGKAHAWGCFVPPPAAPSAAVVGGPPTMATVGVVIGVIGGYVLIATAEGWIKIPLWEWLGLDADPSYPVGKNGAH